MKKLFTLGALLFAGTAFAQMENVGIGTAQPDKSAILDLSSSNKGFLLPRMSESQRLNILKPAQGLQVYQTDGTAGLYVFNGKDWENASKSVAAATDPWLRGGNAIDPGEFIGTTNGQALKFKVFGDDAGTVDYSSVNARLYFGYGSGSSNTGTNNTALGYQASPGGSGGFNTAVGFRPLFSNTTGNSNVAIGNTALYKNTSGRGNMAIGGDALFNNTIGEFNSAIGVDALNQNISGFGNTAIGQGAGLAAKGSYNVFIGNNAGGAEIGSNTLYIANSNTVTPLIYGDFSAKFVTIGDVPASAAKRSDAVTSGGYNLLVKGGILTEKVKVALVTTTDWADYVFEKEYKEKMMSLEDVEKYTLIHKHLPNVPSAQEMVDKGMEVGQTSKMFMEKIEELTLYIIELNKKIKELENRK